MMTDKQVLKQLAKRYKEICRSPFADGYTFRAFDGECAEKGFTIEDIKNYIEKEKQERKAKLTESIKSLKEQRKRKENELEELRQYHNKCCEEFKKEKQDLIDKYNQLSINFYNGDYCNTVHCSLLKSKEKECERLEQTLIQIKEIAEVISLPMGTGKSGNRVILAKQILQKINGAIK